MICPVCSKRFAPLRGDHWAIQYDAKQGWTQIALIDRDKAEKLRTELFDDDYNKCPCYDCLMV